MSSPKCWSRQAALLIFFLCCLFIAWNVPYTHDDWDWGLEESWALWRSGAMNSRYAGTFFVLIMTRSPLVKTLVMGSVMFLLPLLSVRLAAPEKGGDRFPLVGLAGGVLFAMPLFCWRQVFGWVSAFANFVLGGLFLLLVLLLWQRAFSSRKGSVALLSLALFFCCLVTQLFAENISVMLLVASLVVAGYALVTRRARLPALASLAACALGTWLMFHNALYSDLMSNGQALDGIRRLAFSPDAPLPEIVSAVMTRYFTTYEALPGLFENFPAVSGLLAAGCVWRLSRQGTPKWAVAAAGVWMGGYSLFCAWMMHHLILNPQWVHPWPLLRAAAPLLQLGLTAVIVVRDRPGTRAPPASAAGRGGGHGGSLCPHSGGRSQVPVPLRFVSAAVRAVPALRLPLAPPVPPAGRAGSGFRGGFSCVGLCPHRTKRGGADGADRLGCPGRTLLCGIPNGIRIPLLLLGPQPRQPGSGPKFPAFLWPAGAC